MQGRWGNGEDMRRVAATFIKPNDRLTPFERLEIYNRQYWFRIVDCFYDDFPGLRAVLRDHKFDRLAKAYLVRHPSVSFTLRNLGSRLERFLIKEPRWTAPHQGLALDMVRFEWARVVAFDGEARPVLTGMDLSRDPSQLCLHLQPYLFLLEMEYPVDEFLSAIQKKDTLRNDASNAVETKQTPKRQKKVALPKPMKIYLGVHRMENSLYYKRLEPEAFRILMELKRGKSVGQACSFALRSSIRQKKDWPAQVQRWFQNWMSLGWFCK